MKSTWDEEKVKTAISDSEKKTITDKCDECIKWLDNNQTAEKDEYEDKQKELEQIFNPIIQKLYAGGAGGLQVVLVVCQEEPLEDLPPPVVELDLPLRKWTNIHLPKRQPSPVDDFLSIPRLCVVLTVVTAIFCNTYFNIAIS